MAKRPRPYFMTAERVVAKFHRYPKLNSGELGRMLDLHPAYVRKVLQRKGLKLATAKR